MTIYYHGPVPKSLQKWIESGERQFVVQEAEAGPDGLWLFLVPGWINTLTDTHMIHEDTIKEIKEQWEFIGRCDCQDCQ